MANSVGSFYQTVVAAATEASQLLAPTWKASDSIYLNYKSEPATIGQTINVPIPQDPTTSVADMGAGDVAITDVGFNTFPIVFNHHPAFSFVIRDWEQFNSPIQIRELFMDASLKGIKNYTNALITGLFTTGNFSTNAVISTTNHIITTTQFLSAYAILADQYVPVTDSASMSLLLPSTPYAATIGDANWTQAQIAGMKTAETVRATGEMPTAFGATIKLDQQMPTTGSAPSRTFTAAFLHKWAVAAVSRPLPKPDARVVDFTYVNFGGFSIRVSIGWNQYPKQGFIVTVDAGFGLAVIRQNMCQLFSVAE